MSYGDRGTPRTQAKGMLTHYFRRAGVPSGAGITAEIEKIVDLIIDAAVQEIRKDGKPEQDSTAEGPLAERAPSEAERDAVGAELCTHIATHCTLGPAQEDHLIVAIAKRVREAEARGATVALGKDAEAVALAEFMDYVATNYPPGTTIANPQWHAPKLFRAAVHALRQEAPHV